MSAVFRMDARQNRTAPPKSDTILSTGKMIRSAAPLVQLSGGHATRPGPGQPPVCQPPLPPLSLPTQETLLLNACVPATAIGAAVTRGRSTPKLQHVLNMAPPQPCPPMDLPHHSLLLEYPQPTLDASQRMVLSAAHLLVQSQRLGPLSSLEQAGCLPGHREPLGPHSSLPGHRELLGPRSPVPGHRELQGLLGSSLLNSWSLPPPSDQAPSLGGILWRQPGRQQVLLPARLSPRPAEQGAPAASQLLGGEGNQEHSFPRASPTNKRLRAVASCTRIASASPREGRDLLRFSSFHSTDIEEVLPQVSSPWRPLCPKSLLGDGSFQSLGAPRLGQGRPSHGAGSPSTMGRPTLSKNQAFKDQAPSLLETPSSASPIKRKWGGSLSSSSPATLLSGAGAIGATQSTGTTGTVKSRGSTSGEDDVTFPWTSAATMEAPRLLSDVYMEIVARRKIAFTPPESRIAVPLSSSLPDLNEAGRGKDGGLGDAHHNDPPAEEESLDLELRLTTVDVHCKAKPC